MAMSLAIIHSRALDGLSAPAVEVEVHLANGLPSFTLVGLADLEVKESRCRQQISPNREGCEIMDLRAPLRPGPRRQLRTFLFGVDCRAPFQQLIPRRGCGQASFTGRASSRRIYNVPGPDSLEPATISRLLSILTSSNASAREA